MSSLFLFLHPTGRAGALAAVGLTLACMSVARAAPAVGVVADPCAEVPVAATPAHRASADWYGNWMKDWLALDWGQRCRYRAENAQLPPASSQRVVFMGDSITEGWLPAQPTLFNAQVLDRGISGQTTEQMLLRFRGDVLDLHPAVVHLMAGTNDIAGNRGPTTLAQIEANLVMMIEMAQAAHIQVLLGSVPPASAFGWSASTQVAATILTLNEHLRAYARHHQVIYVDYHTALADETGGLRPAYSEDGVHPNAAGYAVMQPLLAAALREALPSSAPAP